ncbi:ribonuclease P protein component [Leptolyngbya sp. 'hensonii']|uniref:ribonuclease P protein component n=1 Tax=Leptolyngbya sp. 'hensonii' TaxID=1922337 RepID=UPI00094FA1B3|nr:ribonuclease P protein component [Leptolyngbya sp. 'hensonii']OLP19656.1 ribonuclease P protein component [Leptolyngbya sp. 'hensonii']
MALPKAHRLRQRRDFDRVYQQGIRRNGLSLALRGLSLSSNPPQFTQIGISISQKVSKRAVVRNRIKRRIRAAIQQLLPEIQAGWLLVIVVRPTAVECEYHQFLRELKQLLADAEVLDGHS